MYCVFVGSGVYGVLKGVVELFMCFEVEVWGGMGVMSNSFVLGFVFILFNVCL